jgi:hypothetical protein
MNLGDVTGERMILRIPEICAVSLDGELVPLGGENTLPIDRLERPANPTDAGKEVDELEIGLPLGLPRGFDRAGRHDGDVTRRL